MNKPTLAFLEFDKFKEILLKFTTSALGSRRVQQISIYTDAEKIEFELVKTFEAIDFIQTKGEIGFSGIEDPSGIFQKLNIAEIVLDPLEILGLLRLVRRGIELKQMFSPKTLGRAIVEFGNLWNLTNEISNFKPLVDKIDGNILPSGEIADSASHELAKIRHSIRSIKDRLQGILDGYLKRRDADKILQDFYITIRNDRFVLPIKVEQKNSIGGVVHGVSSSGATIFLEPFDCIELNNDLIGLEDQEKEEIRKILAEYTREFREELPNLVKLSEVIAEFDFTAAKAKFAVQFTCCKPQINSEGRLALTDARHPLLEEALKAHNQKIVPIAFSVDQRNNALLISGPNTGGKTVSLKTAGLLTLMAHAGIPVPAERAAVPLLNQVLADIGDNQSITESLSTFSSHILNIAGMADELAPPALILLDEVGTGTDPDQEAALGIAIIDYFKRKGALVVATTHHNSIKAYAFNTPGVVNAAMEFDQHTLRPTYKLVTGLAGNSSGIEIAERLGLREEITQAAKRLLSTKDIEAEEYWSKIKRKLLELEQELGRLKNKEAELESEKKRLQQANEKSEQQRRLILTQKVDELVSSFTRDAHKALEEIQDESTRLRLNRHIKRKVTALEASAQKANNQLSPEPERTHIRTQIGDQVRIKSLSVSGRVTKQTDTFVEIDSDGKRLKAKNSDIELVETRSAPKSGPSLPTDVVVEVETCQDKNSELNVIGCTVSEALAKTDKFLDNAILLNLDKVRVIHGHGTGKLRRAISEFLRDRPDVASYNQSENHGAVTTVDLKSE